MSPPPGNIGKQPVSDLTGAWQVIRGAGEQSRGDCPGATLYLSVLPRECDSFFLVPAANRMIPRCHIHQSPRCTTVQTGTRAGNSGPWLSGRLGSSMGILAQAPS